jgi:hypothetical protein
MITHIEMSPVDARRVVAVVAGLLIRPEGLAAQVTEKPTMGADVLAICGELAVAPDHRPRPRMAGVRASGSVDVTQESAFVIPVDLPDLQRIAGL